MLWRPELVPVTIILDRAPDDFDGARPIDPGAAFALRADHTGHDGRHVVVADAEGDHRLWLRDPTPDRRLAVVVPLDADFEMRIASLIRFHRHLLGRRAGPPPRGWPLTQGRRERLELMLRALDMRLAGASYREIAIAMGEREAAGMPATEWKDSRARSWIVRLVADARKMMNGGYRKLLRRH